MASFYCMMLLIWSRKRLEKDGHRCLITYSDLGLHTFGKWGQRAVDSMVILSQGAFCVAYLIFIGENLASIFAQSDAFGFWAIAGQVSVPNSLISLHNSASLASDLGQESGGAVPAMAGEVLGRNSSSFSLLNSSSAAVMANHTFLQLPSMFLATKKRSARALLASQEHSRVDSFFFENWSSKEGYIWIIFPLQIALASIRSLTHLAPFSILADLANLLAMVVVMQQDVVTFAGRGIATVVPNQGLSSLPFAIGVAIYAFEGFGLVLPLESSMKDRRKFGAVLGFAMAAITVLYMAFGLLGYLAFGEGTQDIITLNLGQNWQTMAVKLGLCLGLFFTFPVMMHPVHEVMERRLVRGRRMMILRTTIVLGTVWCAVAVPRFGDFLSLIGNSVCCILAFVLPAAFHLKAHRGELCLYIRGLDYLLLAFGLVFGVWGTISALKDIIGIS